MLGYRYYLPVTLQDGVTLSPSPLPPQDSLPWVVYKLGDYKGLVFTGNTYVVYVCTHTMQNEVV